MEIKLKPQECYYLNRPVLSDPVEMLKYALLGLDMEGHIEIFYKKIYINQNARYKRSRMFVRLGPHHQAMYPYTSAEAFLVSKINKPELRLYEFRNAIAGGLDKKVDDFKSQHVYDDVSAKGFVLLSWLLSSKGRSRLKACKRLIRDLDKDIDLLLQNNAELNKKLEALGSNIIFLEDVTLKKLRKKTHDLEELNHFSTRKAPVAAMAILVTGRFWRRCFRWRRFGWELVAVFFRLWEQ